MAMQDPHLYTSRAKAPLPDIPLDEWQETCTTLHLWTQIVGKIRLALSPMMNHWWQVTLYMTARGLSTSPMFAGREILQIEFDFVEHTLRVQSDSGETRTFPLGGHSVAAFYRDVLSSLHELGADVKIWPLPVEVAEQIPFDQDEKHASYDPDAAHRFWQVLLQVDRVMKVFRSRFCGKASPVHFFWGSFDLATTRFSGRSAPPNEKAYHVAQSVTQEAYCAECSSCGFWPGEGLGEPAFYAYHYPEPRGYAQYQIRPADAYYHPTLREFILPYKAIRQLPDWETVLLSFFQSTYEAGAYSAKWDRDTLEKSFLMKPVYNE